MNPYDLLDVPQTASEDEIREAWKAAIADLGPSDRRFRAYNQAAELLLDPERRAAYDAELAAEQEAAEPAPSTEEPHPAAPVTEEPTPAPAADAAAAGSRRPVPLWLLLAVAALTVAVVAVTIVVWNRPSDSAVEQSTRSAQAAAERAIVPILSYDAATLDEDQEAAQALMTSDYREDYDKLFEVLRQNAPSTGTKVEAQVIASGIVRSGEDRVDILIFVNRPTTNKQYKEPVVYKDQVTVTMQRVGGDWLVDNLVTSPVAQ